MSFSKNILFSFVILAFFNISNIQAGLKAPDFTLSSALRSAIWSVTASAPELHHFNIQAPMSLIMSGSSVKPESASEKSVVFKIPAAAAQIGKLRVSLYLCDDAKTFCEKHELDYTLSTQGGQASTPTDSTEVTSSSAHAKSVGAQMEHGFLVNAPDEALAQAKREGKPLMIDFFGIWCPPCNELDEKVFSTQKFSQSASRFVRLKLDADAQVSWKMKSQYQVGGYPTIVFTSPEGDEISRIVGSRPLPDFLREMDEAWNQRASPLEALEKKAQTGDREAADRAGVIRFNRGDISDAEKWLKGTKKKREFLHLAEIQMFEDKGASTEQRISRLNSAIAEFPKTPNTVTWYENLAKLYGERKEDAKRKAALTQAIDLALSLAKTPAHLKGYDATTADLLEQEASDREDLDGQQAARKDWLAAAHAYRLQGLGDKERANNLEYAFCLGKAGELEKARAIYQRLEQAYPNEFTFYFGHARMESDHGNYAGALLLANQALQYSYGDNRLRAVILVAKIHESLGEKDKSRAVLDETLKDLQLPEDEKVRTHRYAKTIQDMRAKLN